MGGGHVHQGHFFRMSSHDVTNVLPWPRPGCVRAKAGLQTRILLLLIWHEFFVGGRSVRSVDDKRVSKYP